MRWLCGRSRGVRILDRDVFFFWPLSGDGNCALFNCKTSLGEDNKSCRFLEYIVEVPGTDSTVCRSGGAS